MEIEIGRNTSDVGDRVVELGTKADMSEFVAGTGIVVFDSSD